MTKCHNCPKNAMFMVGPKGQEFPLCLDCYLRFQGICLRNIERLERQMNYLESEMEWIAGFRSTPPAYAQPPPVIQAGGVTLKNINVSNSQIGVLNSGTIENVDATVTVLKQGASPELAAAVTALSESVIASAELAAESKNQVLELLYALSSEAVAPKEKRKMTVVRALLSKLSGILSGVGAIAGLWEKTKAILERVLNL